MRANKTFTRIMSVVLSMLMLVSTVVLPETVGLTLTAIAETVDVDSNGEHLTEVPEGYIGIYTASDLNNTFRQQCNINFNYRSNFILMNDIDLSSIHWTPIEYFSIGRVFDGNGYTISNLLLDKSRDFYHNYSGTSGTAFILQNKGTIKNLNIANMRLESKASCGFVLYNSGTLSDLHFTDVSVILTGQIVRYGTVASYNGDYDSGAKIERCSVSGNITIPLNCSSQCGGIAGYNGSLVKECYSSANIYIKNSINNIDNDRVGGIVCYNYLTSYDYDTKKTNYGTVLNCYNSSKLIFDESNSYNNIDRGGIVCFLSDGKSNGKVINCINFSDGRIYCEKSSDSDSGSISSSYVRSGANYGLGGTEISPQNLNNKDYYYSLDFQNTWEVYNNHIRLKNNPENFPISIKIKKAPTKLDFYQNDKFSIDGTVRVQYLNGESKDMDIDMSMVSGYNMGSIGNQIVYISLRDSVTYYSINVLEVPVKSVVLDRTSVDLQPNETWNITANVSPDNASNKHLSWYSSNEDVATVDKNGFVTAVSCGTTDIIATASNGLTAKCELRVIIPAISIWLDKTSANLNTEETLILKTTVLPANSTDDFIWESENAEVAEIDQSGKITAKRPGTTNITVTTESGQFARCYIQVSAPATEISLDRSSIKMYTDESAELTCKVSPEYTTDEVEWSCNNDVVEIVKNNDKSVVIYPCKKGTATVTVTTTSGKKAACAVQVEQIAYGIYFENDYLMLNKGESKKVNPVKDPSDSVDTITWSSENSNIASVDSDGNITGVARGSTTIIAETMRGYRAYVYVDVNVPATEVKFDKSEIEMFTEDSTELTCTISPDDTTDEIIWSCNNNVVEYYYSSDYNRIIIYPLKAGTAVITAASTSGKTATCTIRVNQHANGISFNSKSLKVAKGESKKLTPIFQPPDAVDTIKWSSENTSIATVDNDGNVKGIKSGTTTVTAETANGYKAEIQVEVIVLATGIELDTTEATIFNNETLKLNAILSPSDSTDSVKWTSSDNSVVSVDSEGNVKGISKGTATITATTSSGETAVCEITVNLGANAVTLDKKNTALNVGDTLQLKAAVTPSDSVSSVTWSSDNANIVSVDENGLVTAKAPGTVNVTVETSNGFSDSCEITVTQPSSEIDLKKTNVTVVKGNYTVLKSILTPADSTDTVIWSSNNNAVATVDSDGKVIGVSVGYAVITAETSSGKKITCNVTVKEIVNSISVNRSTLNMRKGTTGILKADVSPADVYAEIMWSSSDKNIVAVDSNGVLTAKNVGTATITAKTTKGLKSSCVVTVDNPSTEIALNKTSASINVNETVKLNYTITPSDTTETVTWTTSNNSIATVSNGTVKGIKAGTVTITAKTSSGRYATCTVEVKQPQATSVSLSQTSVTLTAGNTVSLKATVSPTAANQTVTWTTSNSSVATVSNGTVKAVKAGTATITAKTSNGKTATCSVTVQAATVNPTSVSLNKTSMTLTAGSSTTLTATVYPTNATNKSVTWTTSNSSVATVSNGTVKAVKAGTATITAKTSNGKTATCTVTVKAATVNPTSVSLNKTSVSIDVGSTTTLTATVSPTNATDKSLTWTTSNSSVATVSNGTVKGIKAGTATITVKTSNGKTATCTVTVKVKETQPNISSNCQKLKEYILANPDTTDENGNNAIIYSHNIGNDPLTSAIVYIENIDAFNLIFLKDIDLGRRILENATDIKYYYSSNQVEETELYMETFDSQVNKGYNATLEKKAEDYYKNQDLSAQYSIINIVSMDNDEFKSNVNSERDMAFSEFNTLLKNKLNLTLNDIGFINFDKDNNSQQVEVSVVFLDKQQLTMNIGETATIKVAVGPDNAVNREVFWTSNNESVAKVSNGTITAIGTGTAVITAKTANGKYDTCTVTVNGNSTSVIVNCQNLKNYIINHYTSTTYGGFKTIKLESINSNGEKTYTQFSYDHKTDKLIMVYNVSFNDDGFYQSSFDYDYNKGTLEESEIRFHYSSEFALSCHEQKSSDVTNKLIAPYSVVSSKGYSSSQYQKYALEQHEMALANIDMYLYSIMTINLKDIGFTNYDMFAY